MGQATSDTSQYKNTNTNVQSSNTNLNSNQNFNQVQKNTNYSGGNVNYNPNYFNPQPGYNQSQYTQNQNVQNQNVQNVNVKKFKASLTLNDLSDAFKTYAIEGKYLTQQRFNDTIERLFSKIDIPSMHYTYLSDKIYLLLDESKDGKISEDEFMIGMKNVIGNKDFRLKLSMMAMMTRPEERNYIDFAEIVEFYFKSWVYGFKHLGWQVKRDKSEFISKNLPTPTITQFELWANKFENHVKHHLTNNFKSCGIDISRPIDFETFKSWIYRDNNLKLTYTFKNVTIATSLIGLDEVGFDESGGMSSMSSIPSLSSNSNPPYMRYPSLK